jgi:hypothetical protein
MSLELTPACSTCHSYERVSQCQKCRTVSYCSHECQKLDWEEHKKFCLKNESKEKADQRRNYCLSSIRENEKVVLEYLIKQKFTETKSCLLMQGPNQPLWECSENMHKLSSEGYIKDKTRLDEMDHELARQTQAPALIVFYDDDTESRLYVLSSKKFCDLQRSVTKMPGELLTHIFTISLDIRLSKQS